MPKPLKVYGWSGFHPEAPGPHRQTRCIAAVTSKAEVARIAGVDRPAQLFCLGETGNKEEISVALERPGTVFWRGNGEHDRSNWRNDQDKTWQAPPDPRGRYLAVQYMRDHGHWEGNEPPQWVRAVAARIGQSPGSYATINTIIDEVARELLGL